MKELLFNPVILNVQKSLVTEIITKLYRDSNENQQQNYLYKKNYVNEHHDAKKHLFTRPNIYFYTISINVFHLNDKLLTTDMVYTYMYISAQKCRFLVWLSTKL